MARSDAIKTAQCFNAALKLLQGLSPAEVVGVLRTQYGLSRRQAYRYVREAQRNPRPVVVPERKATFTVKLPLGVIADVRGHARQVDRSISDVVAEALVAFLGEGNHGQAGRTDA